MKCKWQKLLGLNILQVSASKAFEDKVVRIARKDEEAKHEKEMFVETDETQEVKPDTNERKSCVTREGKFSWEQGVAI